MPRWFDVLPFAKSPKGHPADSTPQGNTHPHSSIATSPRTQLGIWLLGHLDRPGGLLFPLVEHVSTTHPVFVIDAHGPLRTISDQRIVELERQRRDLAARYGFHRVLIVAAHEASALAFRYALLCPRSVAWLIAITPSDATFSEIVLYGRLHERTLRPTVDVFYGDFDGGGRRVTEGLRLLLPDLWNGQHGIAEPSQGPSDPVLTRCRALVQERLSFCQTQYSTRVPKAPGDASAKRAAKGFTTSPTTRWPRSATVATPQMRELVASPIRTMQVTSTLVTPSAYALGAAAAAEHPATLEVP